MAKTIFLTLTIVLSIRAVSYAEDWQLISKPNSKFQTLIDKFSKSLHVSDKRDVIEAFHNSSHRVYIDTDSIRVASDGRRNFDLKIVFDEGQAIEGTDKKLKYIVARMFCDCVQEILWFRNGEGYDKDGDVLRHSQTVYVPVDLKGLPNTALERDTWKFVCNYKKGQ